MKQLSNAFRDMQIKNVIHRDVKPSNIMLMSTGVLKLADFGLCKFLDPSQEQVEKLETILNQATDKTVIVGSPIYMAPELLKGQVVNRKVDLYSLGIVLYEMLFGVCPFEETNVDNLLARIEKGVLNFPLERNNISLKTQNLIRDLLRPDSAKRMEWDRFHSFFEENMTDIPSFFSYNSGTSFYAYGNNLSLEKVEPFFIAPDSQQDPFKAHTHAKIEGLLKPEGFLKHELFTRPDPQPIPPDILAKPEGAFKQEGLTKPEPVKNDSFLLKKDPMLIKNDPLLIKNDPSANKSDPWVIRNDPFVIKNDSAFAKFESPVTSKEAFVLIDKRFLKEKNKIVYLSNVINAALDLNLNSLAVLAVLSLLRFQILLYENLLDLLYQDLPKENHIATIKVSNEEWLRYKRSENYRIFTRICQDEQILVKENLINFFKTAQSEMKTLELKYFELNREGITEVLYYYCRTVQGHALLLLSEEEKDLAKKVLIHANNILDAMRLEEFFEKLINEDVLRIDEQAYFGKMIGFTIPKYLQLVEEKLVFFKRLVQK